jgi:peptide methionine sulfoxide reductase msrA/msrB
MTKEIYLAGGCFWGTEHYFKQIRGVVATSVGYANGTTVAPTYEEVYTDRTGHAECVHVVYDPEIVGLEHLIKMFFRSIDPTSLNQQGNDCGTRYRTGIYYTDKQDLEIIEPIYNAVADELDEPIAVELQPLERFYDAEEYHQDYLDKHPTGYCHIPMALMLMAKESNK